MTKTEHGDPWQQLSQRNAENTANVASFAAQREATIGQLTELFESAPSKAFEILLDFVADKSQLTHLSALASTQAQFDRRLHRQRRYDPSRLRIANPF